MFVFDYEKNQQYLIKNVFIDNNYIQKLKVYIKICKINVYYIYVKLFVKNIVINYININENKVQVMLIENIFFGKYI